MNAIAPNPPATVIAVLTDLLFATRVSETARSLGLALTCVSPERLIATAEHLTVTRVVVDLTAQGDPAAAIEALRRTTHGASIPVIAFHPHVNVALGDRARAVGATRVLPRSAFTAKLAAILGGQFDTPPKRDLPGTVPLPESG
ncbi:MAG: hypothetical protein HOP12_13925 [Candidatus Eisenbacteria bacterium]|uniref:Response regulator transcription factor n=1 Tax=Eiseniibacteriota bacterium TaxID=2212470 RepID=A0A849SV54_UNCEI|nr:hypothetical protein [Candidatus Eisenbacteria bacterium]